MTRGEKILIVDHDTKTAKKLYRLFDQQGFKAVVTERATAAIRILQQECVSVLVLDVGIVDMAWQEAIPIIRGLDNALPIIMTAGENTPELETSILHQHVFYYHVKSFGTDDLMLAVRSAVEKSARQRQRKNRHKEAT